MDHFNLKKIDALTQLEKQLNLIWHLLWQSYAVLLVVNGKKGQICRWHKIVEMSLSPLQIMLTRNDLVKHDVKFYIWSTQQSWMGIFLFALDFLGKK